MLGKRLYLDVCTYCRPFDNQNIVRNRLETDAFHLIMEAIEDEKYSAIISPVHIQEVQAIESQQERVEVLTLFEGLNIITKFDKKIIRARAEELCALQFGTADAAHVAFAEAQADIFISCDIKLLKKCQRHNILIETLNPVEFSIREDLR